ncbi:MAG: DNA polymerase III subunit delta' [bacterium]
MKIIGHSKILRHLQRLSQENLLPHALLFTGPSGIGKKRVALHFAQSLFCESPSRPCENCGTCKKVEALQHPDLLFIEPENDLIKIDAIRDLKNALALKPFEAPLKVAVIADAQGLNPAASNALLKTLEEPPPHTLLILTTPSPHQLLKTILSRCQKVYFSPLTAEETKTVLEQNGKHPPAEIVQCAQGSPGLALSLKEEAYELLHQRLIPALESQPKDLLGLFSVAEEMADEDTLQTPVLHLLRMHLKDKLLQQPTSENLRKIDAVEEASRALNRYANPLLTFENLFLNLCL